MINSIYTWGTHRIETPNVHSLVACSDPEQGSEWATKTQSSNQFPYHVLPSKVKLPITLAKGAYVPRYLVLKGKFLFWVSVFVVAIEAVRS